MNLKQKKLLKYLIYTFLTTLSVFLIIFLIIGVSVVVIKTKNNIERNQGAPSMDLPTADAIRSVQYGMSESEVIELLGEPHRQFALPDDHTSVYGSEYSFEYSTLRLTSNPHLWVSFDHDGLVVSLYANEYPIGIGNGTPYGTVYRTSELQRYEMPRSRFERVFR